MTLFILSIAMVSLTCVFGKDMPFPENDARQGSEDSPLCEKNVISDSSNMPDVTLEASDVNRFGFLPAQGTRYDPVLLPFDELAYVPLNCWYPEKTNKQKNSMTSLVPVAMSLHIQKLGRSATKIVSNSAQCYGTAYDQFSKGKGVTRDVPLTLSFLATCSLSAVGIGNTTKQLYVKIIGKEKIISLFRHSAFLLNCSSLFGLASAQVFYRGGLVAMNHYLINQHKNGTETETYTCFASSAFKVVLKYHEPLQLETETHLNKDNSTMTAFRAFKKSSGRQVYGKFNLQCPAGELQPSITMNTTDYITISETFCKRACDETKNYTCSAIFLGPYFGLTTSTAFQPCQCTTNPTDAVVVQHILTPVLSAAVFLISVGIGVAIIIWKKGFCHQQYGPKNLETVTVEVSKATNEIRMLRKEWREGMTELYDNDKDPQDAPTAASAPNGREDQPKEATDN